MKRPHIAILVLLALFVAAGLCSLNQMIIYTPDSARYLAWANSLARFQGFFDITSPEPVRYVVHAPLYPVLLAPAAMIAPLSVIGAKITTLLLAAAALFLFYQWLRRAADDRWALFGTLVLAVNSLTLIYSTQVLSDVPFALCLIAFFLLGERLIGNPEPDPAAEFGFIAVVASALFLREVGLTLMLGSTAFFFWKRQYRRGAWILLVSLLVYLLWFVRNEVIIAGIENPPMRNTRLFFTHLYTPNGASLLSELWSRLVSNMTVYGRLIGRLILFPDFVPRSHLLVSADHPLVTAAIVLLNLVQYPLMGLTIGLACYGVWVQGRRSGSLPLQLVFLVCYFGPILFYPINDIRFLYPLLLLMIYVAVIGAKDVWDRFAAGRRSRLLQILVGAMAVIGLFPNLAWAASYITNSWRYEHATVPFVEELRAKDRYPEQFAKPLFLAGQWVAEHSELNDVVLCRWKELYFWDGERRVLDMDPQTTPDSFDQLLRDYRVRYLVSVTTRGGLSEYESLMTLSAAYRFVKLYAAGNIEVHLVERNTGNGDRAVSQRQATSPVREEFREGIRLLAGATAADAESTFTRLSKRLGGYGAIIFHIGVAREFAGHLDDAENFFRSFRSVPQAGSYLQQAWYHLEIIERLRSAQREVRPFDRAAKYHVVAVNYRELGFRARAYELLRLSVAQESSFYPSLITHAIWSLQDGARNVARLYLDSARSIDSSNILSVELFAMLKTLDSLDREASATNRSVLWLSVARRFAAMGMREDAISASIAARGEDPQSGDALMLLAELYRTKMRLYPERRVLEEYLAQHPEDTAAAAQLAACAGRW